ncbi:sigma factor-like helix-turn-helix DNA-binding protein [Nocardia altamirensis]|uniref:sigma factor-like helix-turn-helix DNA-binding protein n=1 Tax=Nocardia altamirensis TaxID=472158 RepID=UPI00084048B9|nr:sigma factor-like helix-turn-helix DNA-binding protein [Nocardia altamirensis]
MTVSRAVEAPIEPDGTDPELLDLQDDISFEVEEVNELLAELIAMQADRKAKDGEILSARLGVTGAPPETLATIGARYDLSRDRIRQLHTKAVGQLLRQAAQSGHRAASVFARRYPIGTRDQQLVRALLVETYATDTDLAAHELSYLKLRIAGHASEDAKRVAGFVAQRIAAWQKKTNRRLAKLRDAEPRATSQLNPWLGQVDWPGSGTPDALPSASARTVDSDDDGRGHFYLDKVGRDVPFDSGLEARLLWILNASDLVDSFQEQPAAVSYELDGADHVSYPSIVARLTDGRVVLIDVEPLGHVAFHVNRVRAAAGRAYAHGRGWGWLVWTGSLIGVPDLLARKVDARSTARLTELLDQGPAPWAAVRQVRDETGLELLDFVTLVLRNDWRWDRAPFRLSAPPSHPPRT